MSNKNIDTHLLVVEENNAILVYAKFFNSLEQIKLVCVHCRVEYTFPSIHKYEITVYVGNYNSIYW